MGLIAILILNAFAVFITAYLLPGVHLSGIGSALLVAIVFSLVSTFIFPFLLILTLPINILTLGLFSFVLIGFMVILVSWIVPGFNVQNFWWALGFAFVLALVNGLLHSVVREISRF